jgi:lysophospholipase L1-like esterase
VRGSAPRGAPPLSARRRLVAPALGLALALLAAAVLEKVVLRQGNTLHENGRWESTKVGLERGILGAVSFLTTRPALHRDRLDLGAWHGFHELLLREPVSPEEIALRFQLRRVGWVAAITANDGARFEAVRLSRDPAIPSACLAGTTQGAFTAKEPFAVQDLGEGWHALALRREGGVLAVTLDGAPVARCATALPLPTRVGVRGSAADHVEVDDFAVAQAAPARAIAEDFANHRNAPLYFGGALALLLALDAVVARAARRAPGGPAPAVALANGVVLVCAGLALLADTVYFGRIYPKDVDFAGYPNKIEYEGQIAPKLEAKYPLGPPPNGVRRIVVLGTSQTWGSGAAHPDDVWVTRLEKLLNAGAAPGESFELIDAGLPGETSTRLRRDWLRRWIAWRPELLLVNVGNNDRDSEILARNLERIVEANAAGGIRTAFLPEPNCVESRSEKSLTELARKHDAVRVVAQRNEVPVVEAHDALAAERDTGFLWWDRVHLTSFGQERLAQRLYEQRAAWLPSRSGP